MTIMGNANKAIENALDFRKWSTTRHKDMHKGISNKNICVGHGEMLTLRSSTGKVMDTNWIFHEGAHGARCFLFNRCTQYKWDFNECNVPKQKVREKAAELIIKAGRIYGYHGPDTAIQYANGQVNFKESTHSDTEPSTRPTSQPEPEVKKYEFPEVETEALKAPPIQVQQAQEQVKSEPVSSEVKQRAKVHKWTRREQAELYDEIDGILERASGPVRTQSIREQLDPKWLEGREYPGQYITGILQRLHDRYKSPGRGYWELVSSKPSQSTTEPLESDSGSETPLKSESAPASNVSDLTDLEAIKARIAEKRELVDLLEQEADLDKRLASLTQ